ncbi:MAG: hypothetical protein ACRDQZ_12600 [Mycobacteriales bacterium]
MSYQSYPSSQDPRYAGQLPQPLQPGRQPYPPQGQPWPPAGVDYPPGPPGGQLPYGQHSPQPRRGRGPLMGIILGVVVVLIAAVVGGIFLFKDDKSGDGGDSSSGASSNSSLGTTISSTDKALSYQAPKDFKLDKVLGPPDYAATASGKDGFIDSYGFADMGINSARSLQEFAEAHKYLDSTASPDWKQAKVDGQTAVSTTFTDAKKSSFLVYVLAKNGAIVHLSCFPRTSDSGNDDMCSEVLRTIKVGDIRPDA